jgi:hypothetical protein
MTPSGAPRKKAWRNGASIPFGDDAGIIAADIHLDGKRNEWLSLTPFRLTFPAIAVAKPLTIGLTHRGSFGVGAF